MLIGVLPIIAEQYNNTVNFTMKFTPAEASLKKNERGS